MKNFTHYTLKHILEKNHYTVPEMLILLKKLQQELEYNRNVDIIYSAREYDKGKTFTAEDIQFFAIEDLSIQDIEKVLDIIVKFTKISNKPKKIQNDKNIIAIIQKANIKLSCTLQNKTKYFFEYDEKGNPIKETIRKKIVQQKVYRVE